MIGRVRVPFVGPKLVLHKLRLRIQAENPNHEPAGSPNGGQFAPKGEGESSKGASKPKENKATVLTKLGWSKQSGDAKDTMWLHPEHGSITEHGANIKHFDPSGNLVQQMKYNPSKGDTAPQYAQKLAEGGTKAPVTPTTAVPTTDGKPLGLGFTKVGPQLGSNPGGQYKDANGQQYYVKFYSNPDQGKSEVLAGKIYDAMGIHTLKPEMGMVDGKQAVITKWDQSKVGMAASDFDKLNAKQQEQVAKMYYAAVLTKNWDIVGLQHDNIMKDKQTGDLHSVDQGGAFKYRAQGSEKPFGPDISEYKSLRDNNEASGHVIGTALKQNPMAEQAAVKALQNMDMGKMSVLFTKSGVKDSEGLFSSFAARRDALLSQAKAAEPQKDFSTPPITKDQKQAGKETTEDMAKLGWKKEVGIEDGAKLSLYSHPEHGQITMSPDGTFEHSKGNVTHDVGFNPVQYAGGLHKDATALQDKDFAEKGWQKLDGGKDNPKASYMKPGSGVVVVQPDGSWQHISVGGKVTDGKSDALGQVQVDKLGKGGASVQVPNPGNVPGSMHEAALSHGFAYTQKTFLPSTDKANLYLKGDTVLKIGDNGHYKLLKSGETQALGKGAEDMLKDLHEAGHNPISTPAGSSVTAKPVPADVHQYLTDQGFVKGRTSSADGSTLYTKLNSAPKPNEADEEVRVGGKSAAFKHYSSGSGEMHTFDNLDDLKQHLWSPVVKDGAYKDKDGVTQTLPKNSDGKTLAPADMHQALLDKGFNYVKPSGKGYALYKAPSGAAVYVTDPKTGAFEYYPKGVGSDPSGKAVGSGAGAQYVIQKSGDEAKAIPQSSTPTPTAAPEAKNDAGIISHDDAVKGATKGSPGDHVDMLPGMKLSPNEKEAVASYKATSSGINSTALKLASSPIENHSKIMAMDNALAKQRTNKDIVVWRGLGGDYASKLVDTLKVGAVFHPHYYQETSTSEGTSQNFTGSGKSALMLKINVQKGTPAIDTTAATSSHAGEKGIIFSRNVYYKVKSIYKVQHSSGTQTWMDVDLIHPGVTITSMATTFTPDYATWGPAAKKAGLTSDEFMQAMTIVYNPAGVPVVSTGQRLLQLRIAAQLGK